MFIYLYLSVAKDLEALSHRVVIYNSLFKNLTSTCHVQSHVPT